MLLVDATNLSVGGGQTLLVYLLNALKDRPHHALVSTRTSLQGVQNLSTFEPVNPLSGKRQSLLESAIAQHQPETVLCFGNLPPKKKLSNVRTVTYFHNAHLIKT